MSNKCTGGIVQCAFFPKSWGEGWLMFKCITKVIQLGMIDDNSHLMGIPTKYLSGYKPSMGP